MSTNLPSVGILASGRGSNCEAILQAIAEGTLAAKASLILSDNPKAGALELGSKFNVPARYLDPGRPHARLTPDCEPRYVRALQEAEVEWVILAGFMRILSKDFLSHFPDRVVNIHPSLLPSFPGLDAVGQAFAHGVKVTGCTVHFVDAGMDTGPIIHQKAIDVLPGDTEASLRKRLLTHEHRTYVEALQILMSKRYDRQGRRVVIHS